MTDVLALPIFSDAAARNDGDRIERPWKGFWPPIAEKDHKYWLKTDSPEVLKWKFDAGNTFDRPWRAYTRTEAAKVEPAYTIIPTSNGADPVPSREDIRGMLLHALFRQHPTNFDTQK